MFKYCRRSEIEVPVQKQFIQQATSEKNEPREQKLLKLTVISNSELTFEIRIFKVYHRCSYFCVLMFILKKGVPKLFFKYV